MAKLCVTNLEIEGLVPAIELLGEIDTEVRGVEVLFVVKTGGAEFFGGEEGEEALVIFFAIS